MSGTAYASDDTKNVDVDMLGFIAVPYDDGQYSVHMNYARAWNLIGFDGQSSLNTFGGAYHTYLTSPSATTAYNLQIATPEFKDVGDMDLQQSYLKQKVLEMVFQII
jgi:hypothetical protein